MRLSGDQTKRVKSAFQIIKNSLQGLLKSIDDVMLTEVKDNDRIAFRSQFIEAQKLVLSAFDGEEENGKLKKLGHAATSNQMLSRTKSLTTLKTIGLRRQHCLEGFQHDETRMVNEITLDTSLLDLKTQHTTTVH